MFTDTATHRPETGADDDRMCIEKENTVFNFSPFIVKNIQVYF